MAALLFKLRNVPDDEADDIRNLMLEHRIPFYETNAGNWGISMPGIWAENDEDLTRAKELISQYQKDRAIRSRENYEADRREGRNQGFLQKVKQRPLATLGIILFCLFVVYAMTSPFVRLAMNS